MHIRPLWIVAVLLSLPPAIVLAGWLSLPSAETAGQCDLVSPIAPTEASAVEFSRTFRSEILDNPGGAFQISATDADVTSYVALNTYGSQLRDPQIHFVDGTICLSVRLAGLGLLNPKLNMEIRPYVTDGDIQFEIQHFVVNGRVLPAWSRQLVQRISNESIQDAAIPIRVETVQVSHGKMTVAGQRLPDIGY